MNLAGLEWKCLVSINVVAYNDNIQYFLKVKNNVEGIQLKWSSVCIS